MTFWAQFLCTESRAWILLKLSSLGLEFSNKGLSVSASLRFYHLPPLINYTKHFDRADTCIGLIHVYMNSRIQGPKDFA